MKKSFLLIAVLCTLSSAQEDIPGYHQHTGFFISLTAGISGGPIVLDMKSNYGDGQIKFSGAGGVFEVKIGGALIENFILHGDICSRSINSPNVEMDGISGSTGSDVYASDIYIGIGTTYYIMPANIFLQAGLGLGSFSLEAAREKYSSENGFGFTIKIGKEWWVSKSWGLGISAGYSRIAANDKPDSSIDGYSGTMSTNKIFLQFNTTYN